MSREQKFLRVISGEARGVGPALTRSALSVLELAYRAVTRTRNKMFDLGVRGATKIDRPVISVGNLTTGGTGKTPVVAWLADRLRRQLNAEIGILTRGYKSTSGESDEAMLLRSLLHDTAAPAVRVFVNPDRVAAARSAINDRPQIAALVMDDGFQHRRLHRDFDLVLVDAANPFGFDHVLPRGLLREGAAGLDRADAVLITRVNHVADARLSQTNNAIARFKRIAPVFTCSHALGGFVTNTSPPTRVDSPRRVVAFAGIANPVSFGEMLGTEGCDVIETIWFDDHHNYAPVDLERIAATVKRCNAAAVVTTGKDAVKLKGVTDLGGVPLLIGQLQIQFTGDDADRLFECIANSMPQAASFGDS
jgi:tetraacyldisaccharide 4'-kinase